MILQISIQQFIAIQLMQKLGDISIENSLNVTINWQVDQNLLAKNFTTIVNALKELQQAQRNTESQIKDLSSLKDKFDQLGLKVDKIDKNNTPINKETNDSKNTHMDNTNLNNLITRIDKNQNNIMDNIKDINLMNKELGDLKKLIDDLKNQVTYLSQPSGEKQEKKSYGLQEIGANMSKQLQFSAEKMKELEMRLIKTEEQVVKHDKDIKQLLNQKDKNKNQQNNTNKDDNNLQDFKRDIKQRIEIINKKINNQQSDLQNHQQQINQLKQIIAQLEGNNKNNGETNNNTNKQETNISRHDLNDLKRKLDEVDKRETKDYKNLLEEINNLKYQLKNSNHKERLNTQQDYSKTNRKSKDQLADKINDLINRVTYLQKLMAGSKNNLSDQKNPEKLPIINRPKKKDPNLTGFEKQKSGITRKDLSELKADLQAWIKSLFQDNKDRQNYQDLELKIQEIKKSLQKKADAEGTKKGFAFLQNKITQLYLFLTEPDTEDAMIVRKGFNCLSCSKKVEKLRGRIGPKLNWNNMTTTNYSPPRVGYSKPMGGESSIEKEDDQ